ncbi:hypothetical protein M0R72_17660 [Candidatus Pacearchaeota archaeon]|nr:hypothetical protein [Candidatus Pacearchaeota archaeon]
MKVDEYEALFQQYLKSPPEGLWDGDSRTEEQRQQAPEEERATDAGVAICRMLIDEALVLVKSRQAKSNSALLACFKEQNNKWKRLAARINVSETFFKFYLLKSSPSFAPLIDQI